MIDLIRNASEDDVALISNDRLFLYKELSHLINQFENFLQPRSVVIILVNNSVEAVSIFCACLKNGVVPILVDNSVGDFLINRLVDLYKPKQIWCVDKIIDNKYGEISCCQGISLITTNYQTYEICHDLALLLSTSGSTGDPKMVKISYSNLQSNIESIVDYLNIKSIDRHITSLPLAYTYGLSCVTTHLWSSASIILNNSSAVERQFWQTIDNFKPTTIAGVPYNYEILAKVGFDTLAMTSINKYTQAGGSLSVKLRDSIGKHFLNDGNEFWIMYGQTEATARMSFLPPDMFWEKVGSIGRPIPGGKFSLTGINNEGELVYHGNNVSMGYAYNMYDLAKPDVNNGVLFTGDIGMVDDDSYWYIIGAKNRFIKVMGQRINLNYIEEILFANGWPSAVTCRDKKILIYVEGCSDSQIIYIKDFCKHEFALSPTMFIVKNIFAFPRNLNGKIAYNQL